MVELDWDDPKWRARVRVMQIIAAALLLGLLSFTGIVVHLVLSGANPPPPQDQPPVLTYMALGMFLLQALLALLIPRKITAYNIHQVAAGTWKPPGQPVAAAHFPTDDDKLLAIFQTSLIIQLALLEGAGFFACIAYLLEQQAITLVVNGLVVLFMLIAFPSLGRVRGWLAQQSQRMVDIRQSSELR
jgi:hypothetical protein